MFRNVRLWDKNYEQKAYLKYRQAISSMHGTRDELISFCIEQTIGYVDRDIIYKVVDDMLTKRKENV